jgi:hypothetical protein
MRDGLRVRFQSGWLAHLDKRFRVLLAGAIESEVPQAA